MKKILLGIFALIILTPSLTQACTEGVLSKCAPSGTLFDYLKGVLEENMGYIILIAILIIVFSGLQYMFAVGQAAEQAKAKQRIGGILGGVAFYFLILPILSILSSNVLPPAATTPPEEVAEVCPLDIPANEEGYSGSVADFAHLDTAHAAGGNTFPCAYTKWEFDKGWYVNGAAGYNGVPKIKQIPYYTVPYPNPDGSTCDGSKECSIASSGCGIVALAMVLHYWGVHTSVENLAKYSLTHSFRPSNHGTSSTIFKSIASTSGLNYTKTTDWDQIIAALKKRHPVIVAGSGSQPFTDGGHYIVLTGYDPTKHMVFVNDSTEGQNRDNKSYPESQIMSSYVGEGHLLTGTGTFGN